MALTSDFDYINHISLICKNFYSRVPNNRHPVYNRQIEEFNEASKKVFQNLDQGNFKK